VDNIDSDDLPIEVVIGRSYVTSRIRMVVDDISKEAVIRMIKNILRLVPMIFSNNTLSAKSEL